MIKRLHLPLKSTSHHVNHNIHTFTNDYITSLCKQRQFNQALKAFDNVLETNPQLFIGTYSNLISACSFLRSLEYAKKLHTHMLNSNLQPDMILQNHVINMFGKCGSAEDARMVFDNMPQRNLVSWTAVIAAYSQIGPEVEGVRLYVEMLRSGFVADSFAFGSVIKACSALDDVYLGQQLHAHVVKSEFRSHVVAQNALISMYTRFGMVDMARSVFAFIELKDVVSWSSMISGFTKLGYDSEALECFKKMRYHGMFDPNEFIFSSVCSSSGNLRELVYGKQIHALSVKYGLEGDAFSGCSLTDMYAKCGLLCSAKKAFDLIEYPDIASWNALIAGYAHGGDANGAMLNFHHMRCFELKPNGSTVRSLLCGFVDPLFLSQGRQVHSFIIKTCLDVEISVCNALMMMYANCLNCTDAYKLFIENQENADIVSWNAVITSCMHSQHIREVFSLFRRMMLCHEIPDHITVVNLLGACGKLPSLEMGQQVHSYAMKTGFHSKVQVMNASIDMYMKCGSLERAQKVFDSMGNTVDVVSWSSLIVGYAQSGYGEVALKLFKKMTELRIKPNQVTFIGVLTACSHVGLVEEGLDVFETMEKEHGVVPNMEHHSCVVDLLARAGMIDDAEAFIDQMDFEPDVVIWKTLLSACRNHNNLEVGVRAAEKVLEKDPSNAAAYSLLCRLYGASGDWKEMAGLRRLMREQGVKGAPGQSWIEVNEMISVFSGKDAMHPQRKSVVSLVMELHKQTLDLDSVTSLE